MRIPFCISLSLLLVPALSAEAVGGKPSTPWIRSYEIESVTSVTNIPEGASLLNLWVPLPMENPYQEISDLEVRPARAYMITRDRKYGNRMAYISLENPSESFELTISYTVERTENSGGALETATADQMAWTLKPARLIPLSQVVKDIALSSVSKNEGIMEKGRALYDHTLRHMEYDKTGKGWGNGDWQYACDTGRGNCTDYHSYFIGLCRSIGIPAYFEIGYSISRGVSEGEVPGYHCWAYFWDGDRWMPVDISEGDKHREKVNYYFGHHDPNRLALTRGRDITLSPPQKGRPLNYFVFPYGEVDGIRHDSIELKVSFKDKTDI